MKVSLTDAVAKSTLLDQQRLDSLATNAQIASKHQGDFAEFGVYKGGAALLLHNIAPNKILHLFDTFEGMPENDQFEQGHRAGDFSDTSEEKVRELLGPSRNIIFHKGWFPLQKMPNTMYSFVHIDADIYQSTKAGLDYFCPRLVPGGRIVFDDYDWPQCPGVKKAIVEHTMNTKIRFYAVQDAPYQLTLIREL